ncbi:hypothetical protein [Streptomyces sp. Ac-502]|uniref:hypothetical protein n=1 Tax=Streptomyces sp. Ac-502 TaxID=3342801 RepID=UPI0038622F7D
MTLCTAGQVTGPFADLAGAHPALDKILAGLCELHEATGLDADTTSAVLTRLAGDDSILALLPAVLRTLITGPGIAVLPCEQRHAALAHIEALAVHLEALPRFLADEAAADIDPDQP